MDSSNGVHTPPSAWEQAKKAFACDHARRRLVFLDTAAERRRFGRQCLRCGQTESVRKATLSQWEQMQAVAKNEELCKSWHERTVAYWQQLETEVKEAEHREWRAKYNAYINSSQWYDLRKKVFERAQGTCEGCGKERPVQVHHLTYEHMGDEFLWELAAVCLRCHERCHNR